LVAREIGGTTGGVYAATNVQQRSAVAARSRRLIAMTVCAKKMRKREMNDVFYIHRTCIRVTSLAEVYSTVLLVGIRVGV
jgi:hypothetical protein